MRPLFSCLSLFISLQSCKSITPGPRSLQDILSDQLNQTVEPCENFYDFACANGRSSYTSPKTSRKIVELTSAINISDDALVPLYKKSLRKFYDQCIKFNKLKNSSKNKIIYEAIAARIGPAPFLSPETVSNKINLTESWSILGTMARSVRDTMIRWMYMPKGFIKLYTLKMPSNSCRLILGQARQIARMYDVKLKSSNDSIINQSVALCKALSSNIASPKELVRQLETFGVSGKNIRLDEVSHLIPSFHWNAYVEHALPHELRPNWKMIVFIADAHNLARIEEIGKILGRYAVDALRTWTLARIKLAFSNFPCVAHAGTIFSHSIGSMILSELKIDHPSLIDDVTEIWRAIKSSFDLFLNSVTWLNAGEKFKIRKKLDRIAFNAGVPRWIANDSELARRTYTCEANVSYIENYFGALMFRHDFVARQIERDAPPSEYVETLCGHPSFVSNAYHYAGYDHAVVWPTLGKLLGHHDIHNQSLAFRIGNLGRTLGHELGHGFDPTRILSNIPTQLVNASINAYKMQHRCIIKHYSQYCKPDFSFCLEAQKTLNEDVSDILSLKAAYTAYKFMQQLLNDDSSIAVNGKTYSSEQVFFLGYTYGFCTHKWGGNKTGNKTGRHSPRLVRIEAGLKQDRAFARAFDCPAGSKYSPLKTCGLWGDASNIQ